MYSLIVIASHPTVVTALALRHETSHFNPGSSWAPWQSVLKVLFGVALTDDEMPLFKASTGRMLIDSWEGLAEFGQAATDRLIAELAQAVAATRNARYTDSGIDWDSGQ